MNDFHLSSFAGILYAVSCSLWLSSDLGRAAQLLISSSVVCTFPFFWQISINIHARCISWSSYGSRLVNLVQPWVGLSRCIGISSIPYLRHRFQHGIGCWHVCGHYHFSRFRSENEFTRTTWGWAMIESFMFSGWIRHELSKLQLHELVSKQHYTGSNENDPLGPHFWGDFLATNWYIPLNHRCPAKWNFIWDSIPKQ